MSAKSEPAFTYSLVNKNEEGYSFIKGNTKFLTKMSQEELAILSANGDPRVKAEENPSDDKKPVKAAVPAPTV